MKNFNAHKEILRGLTSFNAIPGGVLPIHARLFSSPWVDLAGTQQNAALGNISGSATSGWGGNGSTSAPYRLQFDGQNDVAVIGASAVPELQTAVEQSVEIWFSAEADTGRDEYLIDWLEAFGSTAGLSCKIRARQLMLNLAGSGGWIRCAFVAPLRWYDLVIVKRPGAVDVYLNGTKIFSNVTPNIGAAVSEIVLGASTWRGAGNYGEFFHGAIANVGIWTGVLADTTIAAMFVAGKTGFSAIGPLAVESPPFVFQLLGAIPNPALHGLNLVFSLPKADAGELELLDVSGRVVWHVDIGKLAPGRHTVRVGEGSHMNPGVYWVRLRQGANDQTKKVILLN